MTYTDINHLSSEEIETFYQKYLVEKASTLVKEYKLKPTLANSLFNLLPSDKCDVTCNKCGENKLLAKRLSKKIYLNEPSDVRIAKCDSCGHKHIISNNLINILGDVADCNCDYCEGYRTASKEMAEQRKNEKEKKQLEENTRKIVEAFTIDRLYIPFSESFSEYNLSDVVALMSLMLVRWTNKNGDNDNDDYIAAISSNPVPLYPCDTKLEGHPISSCIRNNLISFDLNRCFHKNFIVKDDGTISYYPLDIPYQTNFMDYDTDSELSNKQVYQWFSRKFTDGYWYREWNNQLLDVWINLGISESIEYAKHMADEYNFDFNNETKISEILRDLLHRYSVSECFYFIYVAYKNAAAFVQSGKSAGRRHAENTIPNKILSLANSGKSYKWDRITSLPRSAFSVILFDVMLRTKNDSGFYLCPGEHYGALLNTVDVEWPEPEAEMQTINISGDSGVYELISCLEEVTFEESSDTERDQLGNLVWIANILGLKKAAKTIDEQLIKQINTEEM